MPNTANAVVRSVLCIASSPMCFAARIAVKKKLESADCTPGLLLDERDPGFSRFLHEEHDRTSPWFKVQTRTGKPWTLAPVARKTAFAIAGAMAMIGVSPAPAEGRSGRFTR